MSDTAASKKQLLLSLQDLNCTYLLGCYFGCYFRSKCSSPFMGWHINTHKSQSGIASYLLHSSLYDSCIQDKHQELALSKMLAENLGCVSHFSLEPKSKPGEITFLNFVNQRSRVQAAENSLLQRVAGFSLRDVGV